MASPVKIQAMFTGIIQAVGHISAVKTMGDDVRLTISAEHLQLADVAIGDSIAVNGVCLTATNITQSHFEVHVSRETLRVTTGLSAHNDSIEFNHINLVDPTNKLTVNLEKALRLNDRLGGHLVSGHVDGIGVVTQIKTLGDCWLLAICAPHELSKYIAQKGSICVNGVSLTVNKIELDTFTVNIIPHTLQQTTLGQLQINDQVNLEIDQIARYVERMTQWAKQDI